MYICVYSNYFSIYPITALKYTASWYLSPTKLLPVANGVFTTAFFNEQQQLELLYAYGVFDFRE
jgi:hypothetical protein